jgi:alkyldihydroxyacetonephosphate synthase
MLARMGGVKGRKKGADAKDKRRPEKKGLVPGLGSAALRVALRNPSLLNELVERAGTRGLGTAMLVVIFEGDRDAVTGGLAKARAVLERSGGVWSGDEPARRWLSHRYAVSYRQAPVYAAGAWVDTMEVAAPWDKLGALYDGVRHALGRHAFVMAHLSHAYPDGCCIYFSFAGSANVAAHDRGEGWDDASVVSYEQAWADALRAAEAAGGTIAHHHGVGRSKAPRLSSEVGSGVDVVRALKRALDPHGIMNQGNLLPGAREERRPASPVALPPAAGASLDTVSQLVDVDASVSVAVVESMVQAQGFTLGLSDEATGSVGAWIAAGARGARDPWVDPADHLVAGFVARFRGVEGDVVVRPAPRRAVGPDLLALVVGMHGRFAQLSRVWLRVHPVGAAQGATAPFRAPAPSPPSEEEERMLQRIEEALEQSPG